MDMLRSIDLFPTRRNGVTCSFIRLCKKDTCLQNISNMFLEILLFFFFLTVPDHILLKEIRSNALLCSNVWSVLDGLTSVNHKLKYASADCFEIEVSQLFIMQKSIENKLLSRRGMTKRWHMLGTISMVIMKMIMEIKIQIKFEKENIFDNINLCSNVIILGNVFWY